MLNSLSENKMRSLCISKYLYLGYYSCAQRQMFPLDRRPPPLEKIKQLSLRRQTNHFLLHARCVNKFPSVPKFDQGRLPDPYPRSAGVLTCVLGVTVTNQLEFSPVFSESLSRKKSWSSHLCSQSHCPESAGVLTCVLGVTVPKEVLEFSPVFSESLSRISWSSHLCSRSHNPKSAGVLTCVLRVTVVNQLEFSPVFSESLSRKKSWSSHLCSRTPDPESAEVLTCVLGATVTKEVLEFSPVFSESLS